MQPHEINDFLGLRGQIQKGLIPSANTVVYHTDLVEFTTQSLWRHTLQQCKWRVGRLPRSEVR